jgi:glycosyltransferase involved in cell wall biosynthesis
MTPLDPTMTSNPRFSIIVPTYNTSDVLSQCLASVYQQSANRKDIEVIVVNDGGREATIDIGALDHGFKLQKFYQDHKGPAAARNLGITKAKGEIILFLDDDSLPAPNWLNATVQAWNTYSDFDGIGGYIISEPTDSIYCRVNSDFFNWYLERHLSEDDSTFIVTCNAGYKKAALERIGLFDDRYKRASGEDRDLNIKILKTGGRLRLDKDILVYHDRDLTFRSFARKNYNYGKAAFEIYLRYPEQEHFSLKDYIQFYSSILGKYKTYKEKILAFSLLTFSQICTFIGYHRAKLSYRENPTVASEAHE